MERSAFENEVLVRELNILKEIAKQHDLLDLFNELLKATKRKVVREQEVYGFLITHSIRFEGSALGIHNIYDASLVIRFIYDVYNHLSFKGFLLFCKNMYRVLARARKYKIESLPEID